MKRFIAGIIFILISTSAFAQPPTIALPIQNIPQEHPVWCWAAVVQQAVLYKTGVNHPQCRIVSIAKGQPCCNHMGKFNGNPACAQLGGLLETRNLIQHFGHNPASIALPANPMVLYQALIQNRVIILRIVTNPMMGHVIVLKGMRFVSTSSGIMPMFLVNDPMAIMPQEIAWPNLLPIWHSAIVVH